MSTNGTVYKNFLNVRIDGASRNHKKIRKYYKKGNSVEINKAVYGESIEGIDIWYKIDQDRFVWSGYIKVENEIKPKIKKVIFTADDYGTIDSIDKGIINAVRKGYLKSITCFTNFGDKGSESQKRIKALHDIGVNESYDLELGVHLTLTCGKPVSKSVNALIDPKNPGYFYDFTDIHNAYKDASEENKKVFLNQMKEEFKAQILSFKANVEIPLMHLTTHHNIHLFNKEFFKIFLEVSRDFALDNIAVPTRSIKSIPSWKDYGYSIVKGRQFKPIKNTEDIRKIFKGEQGTIKTPDFLHTNHYGPLPFQSKYGTSFRNLIDKKKDRFINMLNDLRWGDDDNMEFLLHLREINLDSEQENNKGYEKEIPIDVNNIRYSGINAKAFDSRAAEYFSLTESLDHQNTLPKGVELGSWKNL